MSVLISVPIGMAISQYSNLNHACVIVACPENGAPFLLCALEVFLNRAELSLNSVNSGNRINH